MPKQRPSDGIDLRTALILVASFMVAVITGLLAYVGLHHWALAVLSGGAAVVGAARFFDWLFKAS